MRLTGKEIRRFVLGGASSETLYKDKIVIRPFVDEQLNPNSYNLRLSDKLLVYVNRPERKGRKIILDARKENPTKEVLIPPKGLILKPGTLYLGSTLEWTSVSGNIIPQLSGRSSLGRLGLFIHVTAGFGDTGFMGNWTLELACIQPIRIYAGMEVCQISFEQAVGEVTPYAGKYQGSRTVGASKLYKEFERREDEA